MLNRDILKNALEFHIKMTEGRVDAGETAFFTRQLEHIVAQTYDVLYPELKGRLFVPVDNSVESGAEIYTWRQYDKFGEAREIVDYGDDFPSAEVKGREIKSSIVGVGTSYGYSIQDMRAAMKAGVPLDAMKAEAARRAAEMKLDKMAFFGSTGNATSTYSDSNSLNGIFGLCNNPNVNAYAIPSGASGHKDWPRKTPKEILADINGMANLVWTQSEGIHTPDTLLIDQTSFAYINSTPVNQADSSIFLDATILEYVLRSQSWIKTIDTSVRLNTASGGAAGTGVGGKAMAICYEKRKENLSLIIPQEFEQFPPQFQGLKFKIPCHLRCAGTVVRYPLSMVYGTLAD